MTTAYDLIGLGELLWDCFPNGRKPGGAPANVAFHAQQLGLSAAVATRVGTDALGDELCEFLTAQRLSTELVQRDPQHGTGTVTVAPQGLQTQYTFLENSAWDFLEVDQRWLAACQQTRAICFGTLAQRGAVSRIAIQSAVRATSADCLRVYDVNLRPPFYERATIEASLELANFVKLNDDEASILSEMFGVPAQDEIAFGAWLLRTFDLQRVYITRGDRGAVGLDANHVCAVPGVEVQLVDTVGAGDAFTAACVWSQFQGWQLEKGLQLANRIGALVASHPGAMPELATEFSQLVNAA